MAALANGGHMLADPVHPGTGAARQINHQRRRGVIQQAYDLHRLAAAQLTFQAKHETQAGIHLLQLWLAAGSPDTLHKRRVLGALPDERQQRATGTLTRRSMRPCHGWQRSSHGQPGEATQSHALEDKTTIYTHDSLLKVALPEARSQCTRSPWRWIHHRHRMPGMRAWH